MKKWFAFLLACLLFVLAIPPVSAAAATASVKAGNDKVTVGSTVAVTVTHTADTNVAAFDATVNYDAAVLEYVSASGASVNGGAGVLKVSYFATAAPSGKSHSFTLTFKAKAAGSSKVSISSTGLSDWDLNSLGSASANTTISVQNPTLSNNANLTRLYVSSGSLSPAFSPNVTSYNITIPYSATVLTVSTVTADKNAKVEVTGSKNMQVGKNTRVVKVTAPDGTVKSYTLNITRQENTGADKEPAPETTKVTVGEETRYIASDLTGIPLPTGYEKGELTVNDVKFPSVQDKSRSIVLLYLLNETKDAGEFFVYNAGSMTFSPFASVNIQAGTYAFLTPDNTVTVPEGFTQTFITVNEKTVVAWSFPGQTEPEQYLVYALSPAGKKALYRYDSVEGTFLRYVADAAMIEEQPEIEPDENLTDGSAIGGFFGKIKQTVSGWAEKIGRGRMIAIAVGAGLLLIALIVLIVLFIRRPKEYKH